MQGLHYRAAKSKDLGPYFSDILATKMKLNTDESLPREQIGKESLDEIYYNNHTKITRTNKQMGNFLIYAKNLWVWLQQIFIFQLANQVSF